jgi:uncharacterized RDD family membrane protein YckC
MSEQPPSGSSAPPPAAPGPVVARPGELLDRFLARLIDGILLAIVNSIIVTAIIIGAVMGASGGLYGAASSYAATAVSAIVTATIYMSYFGILESSRGQTVGKMVMKLRTTGPDGNNPSLEQALRRNIFMAFGLLALIPVIGSLAGSLLTLVAVIMIAVGINGDTVGRQGWHDHFGGETRVWKIG